jgi:kumamolisin
MADTGDPHMLFYDARDGFRDITAGDNRSGNIGYAATKGRDPCTGLGSPIGAELRALVASAG